MGLPDVYQQIVNECRFALFEAMGTRWDSPKWQEYATKRKQIMDLLDLTVDQAENLIKNGRKEI